MNNKQFIIACRIHALHDLWNIVSETTDDYQLRVKILSLLFNQGLTNSSKQTGLFNDQYLRDGYVPDVDQSLIFKVIAGLHEQKYFIPLIEHSSADNLLVYLRALKQQSYNLELTKIKFLNRSVTCLVVTLPTSNSEPNEQIIKLIRLIGNRGALATKDTLLWLFTLQTQKIKLYFNSLIKLNPNLTQAEVSHCITEHRTSLQENKHKTNTQLVTKIKESLIQSIPAKNIELLQPDSYEFYLHYLHVLISKLNLDADTPVKRQLINLALQRINFKIDYALEHAHSYADFISGLEFAFDEITFILSIMQPYSAQEVLATIRDNLSQNLNLPAAQQPAHTALTGSCMHTLNLHIGDSLNYLAKRNYRPVAMYIGPNIYHEIPESWHMSVDYDGDRYVVMQDQRPVEVEKYSQQAVDLMILATNANVNLKKRGFASTDVHSLITQQLKLRTKQSSSAQLIVILDATMNNLNDIQLEVLLYAFSTQISSGQLAILVAFSLNKYAHAGFDRSTAGLSIGCYEPKHFSNLKATDSLIGFDEADSTPQIVAHMLKHGRAFIDEYYNRVHALSRYIHDQIIPSQLYDSNNYIHIDYPYTQDVYKNPWSFLVIRFTAGKLASLLEKLLVDFLPKINIKFRDGFAFNETTYIILETAQPPILRISIGPEAKQQQFALLVKYLEQLNSTIKHFSCDPLLVDRLQTITVSLDKVNSRLTI